MRGCVVGEIRAPGKVQTTTRIRKGMCGRVVCCRGGAWCFFPRGCGISLDGQGERAGGGQPTGMQPIVVVTLPGTMQVCHPCGWGGCHLCHGERAMQDLPGDLGIAPETGRGSIRHPEEIQEARSLCQEGGGQFLGLHKTADHLQGRLFPSQLGDHFGPDLPGAQQQRIVEQHKGGLMISTGVGDGAACVHGVGGLDPVKQGLPAIGIHGRCDAWSARQEIRGRVGRKGLPHGHQDTVWLRRCCRRWVLLVVRVCRMTLAHRLPGENRDWPACVEQGTKGGDGSLHHLQQAPPVNLGRVLEARGEQMCHEGCDDPMV